MELFGNIGSAATRAVLMTAEAVKVDINLTDIDMSAGDHTSEEFVKMNPQKTIPVLKDGDLKIRESRAAMIYLVQKYGQGDELYPKDHGSAANINQLLFFDVGTLYQRLAEFYVPQIMDKQAADPKKWKLMEDAMKCFDTYIGNEEFVNGKEMSIADISLFTTVSSYEAIQFDLSKFGNVSRWYANMKKVAPGTDICSEGQQLMFSFFKKNSIIK